MLFYKCVYSNTNILNMLIADKDKILKYKLYRLQKELGIYYYVFKLKEQVVVNKAIFCFITFKLLTGAINRFRKNYCFLQA